MKNVPVWGMASLALSLCMLSCKQTQPVTTPTPNTDEAHGHTHYPIFSDVPAHKLIFPSKVPDRIIVNLTEDAAHSFAVNWRTDQTVDTAYVEVALETDGPDFRLGNHRRRILAETQLFENENIRDNEPKVKAAYHSAIVDGLEPGKTYVYRVGDGTGNYDTWSEWFQIETPAPNHPFSFIYFGDAQTEVKSMWSRVIRKSYKMMPKVDFMLHAGDLINHSEANVEWAAGFMRAALFMPRYPAS